MDRFGDIRIQGFPQSPARLKESLRQTVVSRSTRRVGRLAVQGNILKDFTARMGLVGIERFYPLPHDRRLPFPRIEIVQKYSNVNTTQVKSHVGAGLSLDQAKLSALMLAFENFSLLGDDLFLRRGSYAWLSKQWALVRPDLLELTNKRNVPNVDEPLMWSSAYSVKLDAEILLPAECIWMPFDPENYFTKSYFNPTRVGCRAGLSYLDAVVQSTYDQVESHLLSTLTNLTFDVYIEDPLNHFSRHELRGLQGDPEILIYSIHFRKPNAALPMCVVRIGADHDSPVGFGAAPTVFRAARRALDSAMRYGCDYSESYIKLVQDCFRSIRGEVTRSPSPTRAGRKPATRVTEDSVAEWRRLRHWLAAVGCDDVWIVNLTRKGVDIPVVKVIIPGLNRNMPARNNNIPEK